MEELRSCYNCIYSESLQANGPPKLPVGVRTIPLSQGKFALIDAADYAQVSQYSWYARPNYIRMHTSNKSSGFARDDKLDITWYAMRREGNRTIRMHRQITNAKRGQVVDHINHNGLDNRQCNLRVCSHAENMRNSRSRSGRTSRYKGVSRDTQSGKWRAQIWQSKKTHYLGLFDSEIAAALAYNVKARELFGEFAYLNNV